MHDPFEESLRDMLNSSSSSRDDDACLGRVLKTANRQVGAGVLFGPLVRGLDDRREQRFGARFSCFSPHRGRCAFYR